MVGRSQSFDARLFQKLDHTWTNFKMKRLKKQSYYGSTSVNIGHTPEIHHHPRFRIASLFGASPNANEVQYNDTYNHHYEVPSSILEPPRPVPPRVPPKYHKSTSSLVRRSSSKLSLGGSNNIYVDPIGDPSAAVLLSVKKHPDQSSIYEPINVTDDSNYYSSTSSSKDYSPSFHARSGANKSGIKNKNSSSSKMGFLKFFQKSAKPERNVTKNKNRLALPTTLPQEQYQPLYRNHYEFAAEKATPRLISSSKRQTALPPNFTDEGIPIELPTLPRLPTQNITSNTSATFSAKEHLMFMLKKRKRGGKFAPNHREDLASSSMSSLNSNRQVTPTTRRYPFSKNRSLLSRPGHSKPQSQTIKATVEASNMASSSTNSVNSTTSSTEEEGSGGVDSIANGSNYDSGAFSRTSSPADDLFSDHDHPPRRLAGADRYLSQSHEILTPRSPRKAISNANTTALLKQMRISLSASMSRLALNEPLHAPGLVLAAISKADGLDEDERKIHQLDTSLVWACLNAASESSTLEKHFRGGDSIDSGCVLSKNSTLNRTPRKLPSTDPVCISNDVSVTVGSNTMLTITANEASKRLLERNLRRSRSGLPLMGTSGLSPSRRTPENGSPKHIKKRNKISTVYLQDGASQLESVKPKACKRISRILERSDSMVTVMGSTPGPVPSYQSKDGLGCKCQEVVTVNGQHLHCPDSVLGRHPLAKVLGTDPSDVGCYPISHSPDVSMLNDASSLYSNSDASQTQPNSLIHI